MIEAIKAAFATAGHPDMKVKGSGDTVWVVEGPTGWCVALTCAEGADPEPRIANAVRTYQRSLPEVAS